MALYKYLSKTFRNKDSLKRLIRERLIQWRKDSAVSRIDHPSNLISARRLGYRAKPGFVLVRVRVKRGGKRRPDITGGRRSAHSSQRLVLSKNYQWMAEERVAKAYPNLEVLNSYKAAKDGIYYWFEVVLVDPEHPAVKNDDKINWICRPANRKRVFKGLTSAGKKSRGIIYKGKGTEKIRPSIRANKGRAK